MKALKHVLKKVLAGSAVIAAMWASAGSAEENVLYVYNWADYIGETTIADFEKETGIKVVYDTYDASETVDAKLLAGRSGYDVVLHAGSFLPPLIQAGIFEQIDKSKLKNYSHLDSGILKILENWDEGNQYGVPYMWGTTGLTYNVDMVKERLPNAPLDSAEILFNPDMVSKLADCGVTILDSPVDVIPMALSYLGLDPSSTNKDDYKKVEDLMSKVRPHIRTFDSSSYLNSLPNQEICMAMTWSGDYAVAAGRAAEAGKDVNLAYNIPKEGAGAWFDVWVIPEDAPHKEAAYKWMDYMMRPEVIAAATNYTWYANANKDATPMVVEDVRNDPAVYPDNTVKARLFTQKVLPPKVKRVMTRTWSKIKTGR
ncbi:polyamine ABC transporter substrate-binding protein [Aestuariispira insulae]|uniref:Putrescine-binding periplasmic protein n=1 Tax=Aestuariispira insulae TaxID=1461337 RepID=A0A3D9H6S0_9PROT|nr:polyamine ABC transporter substrate-binding protein [Aestuariispira insulae]RED44646.1 spermidine/putrescine-binding protein [Aestuariispira insulae]